MYILGISAFYHDSAACLIHHDEVIAAAQEERFSRIKNDAAFPAEAIKYCLREAGITLADIEHVVFYEKPFLKFERLLESYVATAPFGLRSFLKAIPLWLREKLFQKRLINRELNNIDAAWPKRNHKLLFTGHHQSHAASGYYPSPFEKALILTIDGVGEWTTTSAWIGAGNTLSMVSDMPFPHSLGLLYSAFTQYLGFKVNSDEYKVMGLAPYGQPRFAELILREIVDLKPNGSFQLNMCYFDFMGGLSMINKHFIKLFGKPARLPDAEIDEFYMDVAASIQSVTERILITMVTFLSEKHQLTDLCLAGGVALNCVANGKLLKHTPIKRLWVQPAAGDAGGALGAAFAARYLHLKFTRQAKEGDSMKQSLLGPAWSTAEVEDALRAEALSYHILVDDEFLQAVANYINDGKVVGWFSGRMEFGPRALGARSILGDCRGADMQRHINMKVKFRESFRPFAPAILEEHAAQYYDIAQSSPYMLIVADLLQEYQRASNADVKGFEKLKDISSPFPAVTHVDSTSRLQTIGPANGKFYQLLRAFYQLTGCPAIVNTSFNVKDQPIVCSPADAIDCFLKTDIDVLAIENIIVLKQH
ncbi:carbamoyltransferase family protein [Mucilaginibacter pedocola]|uniref:Carbamoyltransferase n=1 Tax=Mucilaginibacter pedocola TaxID=1792845 RepID=A0A1S9P9Y1_9SPHI|nr:carbamoyltransferase [Mucilaginibacter pedocola]OOQ57729.1 hypothetical protein BC343_13125 [Mucilaginibacter pedocola]